MDGIVYAYRNKINGKHYVGQTTQPEKRHHAHMSGRSGKSVRFGNAVKKYGPDAFEYEVLVSGVPTDDLNAWERYFVWLFHSLTMGYNMTPGGDFDRELHNSPIFKKNKAAAISRAWLKPGYKEMMHHKMVVAQSNPDTNRRRAISRGNTMARPEVRDRHRQSTTIAQRKLTQRIIRSKPIICVETGEWFLNTYEVKRQKGHDNGSINRVCNGKTKRCGGYHWRFATPEETEKALRGLHE